MFSSLYRRDYEAFLVTNSLLGKAALSKRNKSFYQVRENRVFSLMRPVVSKFVFRLPIYNDADSFIG